ncbi:Uma2 family endonuclease [Clostridium oceanicum]
MNIDYGHFYREKDFEEIQANYNGKAEYDNGDIFLSLNNSRLHNAIINNINTYLTLYLKGGKCKSYTEQIEVIFKSENDTRKYKPDVFVMCDNATTEGESFTYVPKIIFEIISKSTASHDYITKLAVYQKYQVEEYNIVEQDGKIVQYSLEDGQYRITNAFKNDDEYVSTVFPDLKINLKDIFE